MVKKKVLYVCHNHPHVRPGGAEAYALELHEAMRASADFEPLFLARTGPPVSSLGPPRPDAVVCPVEEQDDEFFFFTNLDDYDWLHGVLRDKHACLRHFADFLTACRPGLVHFQHSLFFGYDFLRQTRNVLPHAPIVYTLHEYLPICHRQGQMVRTRNMELCTQATPRHCHECFPDISPQAFFRRQRFIQAHLSLVDLFLAPSRFLLERYVAWGIPRAQIRFEDYGRLAAVSAAESREGQVHNRLGFFGQFTPYKGVDVLLQAMTLLGDGEDIHLWVHGANLRIQPESFQNTIRSHLEETAANVTVVGRYSPEDLPQLMANVDWVVVPSIWWENSPLVIQEAFQHRRPVICSDVGGMAEKVADGVSGLHFRVGDPASLAETIRRAVQTPGLWEKLRSGIPEVYKMADHVTVLTEIYHNLLDSSRSRAA